MKVTRRGFLASTLGGLSIASVFADAPVDRDLGLLIYSYGIRARAERDRGFSDPAAFLEFARERGAGAVQMSLGVRSEAEALTVRRAAEKVSMVVEGIVTPPADDGPGLERFTAELNTAKACGATVVRTVLLGGRRYETFSKPDDYSAFAKRAAEMLQRAEPVARKLGVKLAVENHKDFRTDELLDLLKRLASEFVGVCVDTGNNLALLEDPRAVIEALAPFTLTVHFKDVGVEEYADGFRLAEVPLGQGILDLKAIVSLLRKANPRVLFMLEMITRDPLLIPCLTEKYWATLARVPARDLARTLTLVRQSPRKEPLPRVTPLSPADQLQAEETNVRQSFAFVGKSGLLREA